MTAWLTESFAREEKLRPLRVVLGKREEPEAKMTPEQEVVLWTAWANAHNAAIAARGQ